MNMNATPLTLGQSGLRQLAFNGKHYFFTLFAQDKIAQTTENFTLLRNIPTQRIYDCLTFDPDACCFWATVQGCSSRLFQLSCDMEEIACLSLPHLSPPSLCHPHPHFQGNITGLSYCSCEKSLFIAFPWGIIRYFLQSNTFSPLPPLQGMITSVLSLCPAYLAITRLGKIQTLHIFFQDGTKIKEIPLPNSLSVRSMIYNPCSCSNPHLDFLLSQGGCYPQIAQEPLTPYELGFSPCICTHKICQHSCCLPSCDPIDDVLESIALVETALSHILNAQGEELQRIVAESTSLDEILLANTHVNDTITKVTHLEMILHDKLESLGKICPCNLPICESN